MAAEPAEELLRAVREEHTARARAQGEESEVLAVRERHGESFRGRAMPPVFKHRPPVTARTAPFG